MSQQFMQIMLLFFVALFLIAIPTAIFQSFVGLLIGVIVLFFIALYILGAWLFTHYLKKHHIDLEAWLSKVRRQNERKAGMHFNDN